MDARHFLDEIFLDRQIEPIAWWRNQEIVAVCFKRESQAMQQARNVALVQFNTEQPLRARGAHLHGTARGKTGFRFAHWSGGAAA